MNKNALKTGIFVSLFLMSLVPLAVSIYSSLTINAEWTYDQTGFSVYADASHFLKYEDGNSILLGAFNDSFHSGQTSFWVVNEGTLQVEVFPHFSGTNITGYFDTTDMVLGVGGETVVVFYYDVSGAGSGQISFTQSP